MTNTTMQVRPTLLSPAKWPQSILPPAVTSPTACPCPIRPPGPPSPRGRYLHAHSRHAHAPAHVTCSYAHAQAMQPRCWLAACHPPHMHASMHASTHAHRPGTSSRTQQPRHANPLAAFNSIEKNGCPPQACMHACMSACGRVWRHACNDAMCTALRCAPTACRRGPGHRRLSG